MALKVAQHFISIQGEGPSAGIPAVFLRLSMCVCMCVWCDTIEVWKKGETHTNEELYVLFKDLGYLAAFDRGVMLVITGGDPMIQQKEVIEFLKYLKAKGQVLPRIEVETQASFAPLPELIEFVTQWNISPKLANSGMEKDRRYRPAILRHYRDYGAIFKFPVISDTDLEEVTQIVNDLGLPKTKVYLMPICDTQADHAARSDSVVQMCLKTGWRYSPRLQLAIWDQTCGK